MSRRVTSAVDLQPGEYAKLPVKMRYGTFDVWWVRTPNGLLGRLSMPEDVVAGRVAGCHHVEEHEDGTISVLPQPGNSNSIFVEGWSFDAGTRAEGEPLMSWHGY